MSKPTEEKASLLLGIMLDKLTDIIRDGVDVVDKAGNLVNVPAPAAYMTVAAKLLSDNKVTIVRRGDTQLDELDRMLAKSRAGRLSKDELEAEAERFASQHLN